MICRGCMAPISYQFVALKTEAMRDLFHRCSNLEIKENDSLPKHLCENCFKFCNEWNKFQKQCEESQTKFNEIKIEQIDFEVVEPEPISIFEITIKQEEPEEKPSVKPVFITCSICDVMMASEELYEEHKILTHTVEIFPVNFKCKICDLEFYKLRPYVQHYQTHTEFICRVCNKEYTKYLSLQRHIMQMHSDPKFECNICQLKFKHKLSLKLHNKKHKNETAGCCQFCGRTFNSLQSLRRHVTLVHDPESQEPKFLCDLCSHKNKSKAGLAAHMKLHTEEKKVSCEFCEKKFRRKSVSIQLKFGILEIIFLFF